jgi:hypothetical protein
MNFCKNHIGKRKDIHEKFKNYVEKIRAGK